MLELKLMELTMSDEHILSVKAYFNRFANRNCEGTE